MAHSQYNDKSEKSQTCSLSFLAECVLAFAQSLVIGVKPLSLCTLFDTNAHDGPNLSSPVYVV